MKKIIKSVPIHSRRGKVNHKVRNVITVAIGEIQEKTAELTANLYGLLGSDEDYKEYHHIGYDITASRIFENVLRFTENYNNNQKVFFITGARSAGGVANLLSKKLIDKFGSSSVYGYTFNAVSTINGNMIPEGSKIPNLKYASIMNIYNDDEMMVMFTSEETNMYKYGTNVHMSLSENLTPKVKAAFRNVHRSNYDENMKSKVVDAINRTFNIRLSGYSAFVFGMTGTEWRDWDDYSADEINQYSAKEIHDALSDNDVEELFNFWSEFYKVTNNNSDFDTEIVNYAESQKNKITEIRDIRKKLGASTLNRNTNPMAFNNAMNETGVSGVTPPSIPPSNNENSGTITYDRELIKTIVSAAKFYINHIPTYKGKLKTRVNKGSISYDENDLAIKHLTDDLDAYSNATNTNTVEYNNNNKIKLTKTLDNNNKITGAKREFQMINETDGKNMYFDSNFSLGHYKWKNIINSGSLYQVKTDFTGWDYTKDDCSGSIEFILNIRESENNALYNTGITTNDLMSWTGSTANALYKKGWVCYIKNTDTNTWYEAASTVVAEAKPTTDIVTKGIKFLQPGDLLLCTGHGEFYTGNGYTVKYVTGSDKKSGVSNIKLPTNFSQVSGVKAEGTFAWGSVKDEFPVESSTGQKHYFYYDSIANVFRHCECGREIDVAHSTSCALSPSNENYGRQYTVIWRKK